MMHRNPRWSFGKLLLSAKTLELRSLGRVYGRRAVVQAASHLSTGPVDPGDDECRTATQELPEWHYLPKAPSGLLIFWSWSSRFSAKTETKCENFNVQQIKGLNTPLWVVVYPRHPSVHGASVRLFPRRIFHIQIRKECHLI